jgi:hypothetical protein
VRGTAKILCRTRCPLPRGSCEEVIAAEDSPEYKPVDEKDTVPADTVNAEFNQEMSRGQVSPRDKDIQHVPDDTCRHQLRQIAVRQLTVNSMGYSCQQLRQLTVSSMGCSRQQIRQLTISRMRLLNARQVGTAQTLQCLLCQQQILLGIGIPSRIIGHTWPPDHSSC